MPSEPLPDRSDLGVRGRRDAGLALAAFVLLTFIHTWPLITAPATLSRNDNADAVLNEWTLAWVAHQLPRHPLQLFQANIFYPEPNTLAFSEHLFVQSVLGLPAFALGASPVLAFNILLFAGFALSGWAMYLLIVQWTGDRAAAFVAGSLTAFNAHVFTRLPHMQALHVEFIPAIVYALDRFLERPDPRRATLLAVCFAAQSLTSNYWMAFLAVAVPVAALASVEDWRGPRLRIIAGPALLAAVLASAILFPFLLPYYHANTTQGLTRTLRDAAWYSGSWRDYLSTGTQMHFRAWSHHFWQPGESTALFPGFAATLLAIVAVVAGRGLKERRVRLWAVLAIVAFLISFGTRFPGYSVLYRLMPLLQGVRAPARAGHLVLIAVAALAGLGLATLRQRYAGRRWVPAATVAVFLIVTVEAFRAPIGYVAANLPGRTYAILAQERRAVVAEFPMPEPRNPGPNAQYMLNSTRHWKPLVNGYSGFVPASYFRHWERLQSFPSVESLLALSDIGVTHVIAHLDAMPPFVAPPALQLIAEADGVAVYRFHPERIGFQFQP